MAKIEANGSNTGWIQGYREWSPRIVAVSCVALAALIVLISALSAWGNIKIAAMQGAHGVWQHSPYTIALPVVLNVLMLTALVALLTRGESRADAEPKTGEMHSVAAPMPGVCVEMKVQVGDHVEAHTPVCLIEGMKMEITIRAGVAGRVKEVCVTPRTLLVQGSPLLRIEKL